MVVVDGPRAPPRLTFDDTGQPNITPAKPRSDVSCIHIHYDQRISCLGNYTLHLAEAKRTGKP
ncbi:hypothetical protein Daudx_2006 [Candidatus Desulforudis audaxviator]|nr:hypothetical protein Daudx_2006 [Candidatus Desulforudis audaxviator]